MSFDVHSILKKLPRYLIKYLKNLEAQDTGSSTMWKGTFETWEEAESCSQGYSADQILNTVKASMLKIRSGEAVYERDSVLFDKVQYSWPLLSCLQQVFISSKEHRLHVADFGGSLGSTYFQNLTFLNSISELHWTVVEQDHFVRCGQEFFSDHRLHFHYNLQDSNLEYPVNCLLLSGVLQYLSNPLEWIEKFKDYGFEYIILDRTGLIDDSDSIITIQNVPDEIYSATYPCWFFSERQLLQLFKSDYDLVVDFNDSFTPDIQHNNKRCYWKGFFLKLK